MPLMVSGEYRMLIREFNDYFYDEMDEIGDYDLEQELEILEALGGYRY